MNNNTNTIKIAMADDHIMLRDALASQMLGLGDCDIIFMAKNGFEVMEKMNQRLVPDVLILDYSF